MSQAFTKARSRLLLDQPFFGTLCLRLTPVSTEEIETAATDGKQLLYNPKFFESLAEPERVGLLAHEVMHVVLLHMTRINGRDHQRWNVAGDYVINLIVRDAGLILPQTDLLDDRYANWTTDAVYDDLPPDPLGNMIKVKLWDGEQDVIENNQIIKNRGEFEAEMQVAVQQAAEAAKAQGKLPASLESIIEGITEPKVDWKTVLARFLRSNNKSDFSWAKPNRRFIANGMYLPSLHTPALEEIAVAVDTSGSVSDKELEIFTSETSHILLDTNPERVHFLQCDTQVCSDDEYTKENLPLKVTYKGRGGTMFSPVIDYINQHYPNVSALVYLTDLGSNDFGIEPNYPVLWVTTDLEDAPYGQVIKI